MGSAGFTLLVRNMPTIALRDMGRLEARGWLSDVYCDVILGIAADLIW